MDARAENVVLGRKLKQLRESLGKQITEAARDLGFKNYQTLDSIEKGRRALKAVELVRLAQYYGMDPNFLLLEVGHAQERVEVRWRARKDDTAAVRYENRFVDYCRSYNSFEERLGLSRNGSKTMENLAGTIPGGFRRFDDAADLARSCSKKWLDLESRPSLTLTRMLEERLGVRILYWALGDAGSAASAVGDFGYGIMINSDEAPWRRNFDLAHELFHLITWNVLPSKDTSCGTAALTVESSKKSRAEQFADCFASNLLLPEEHLRTALNNVSTEGRVSDIELVVNLAIDFGVSVEALLWRLKTLRLLKSTQVSKILEEHKETILRYQRSVRTWDKERPEFSNRYVFMAVRCFQLGLVSKARLAQYLDTDLADVEETVARYGYTLSGENAFEEADSC